MTSYGKYLLSFLAIVALGFGSAMTAHATTIGVCDPTTSDALFNPGRVARCSKSLTLSNNNTMLVIVLTNTTPAANGGFITADAFNFAAGTTITSFTSTNANFTFRQQLSAGGFNTTPPATSSRNSLIAIQNDIFVGIGIPSDVTQGIAAGSSATFTFTGNFAGNTEASLLTSEVIRFRNLFDPGTIFITSDRMDVIIAPSAPSAVPEPTTMLLLGTGLTGIAVKLRRRNKKA
jgi:hypothetical protein